MKHQSNDWDFLLSELNRFTINSDYHNHNDTGRQALRDDGGGTPIAGRAYWLRSVGATGNPIAFVNNAGARTAAGAISATVGIRPSLRKYKCYAL